MNSNDIELMKQVVHTHRTSCPSSLPRGFGELNPSPHSWIFTSVSVEFIHRSHLFTSAMVWIAVTFPPNCGTEPIRYVTLHLGDRRVAASLRYRYRTKIMVLMCEQNPYPVWFGFVPAQELSGTSVNRVWESLHCPFIGNYEWIPTINGNKW